MGVKLINTLASQLKTGLTVAEFSGGIKEYQSSMSSIPQFTFIGQYTYQNRGIVCAIDPKIILLSAQRSFGGDSTAPTIKSNTFSFSENFVGKMILNIIEGYFNTKDCPLTLNRIESSKDRSHLFFSDEQVAFIEMNCLNNGDEIGKISLIYPITFVKQEKEKW